VTRALRAVESAQLSLQLFTNRYQEGVDNYLQVITAQTVTLANQRTEIDILRRRIDASVLLVKALGGGWDVGLRCPSPRSSPGQRCCVRSMSSNPAKS
jgi:outer membrane protein TolC